MASFVAPQEAEVDIYFPSYAANVVVPGVLLRNNDAQVLTLAYFRKSTPLEEVLDPFIRLSTDNVVIYLQ